MVAEPGMVEMSGAGMQVVFAEAKLLLDRRERSRANYSSLDFFSPLVRRQAAWYSSDLRMLRSRHLIISPRQRLQTWRS
jgi:hypothetical protein